MFGYNYGQHNYSVKFHMSVAGRVFDFTGVENSMFP